MWGSWFGMTMGGLLVVLLIVAVAFGTSALLFPLLIAAAVLAVIGVLYVLGAVGSRTPPAGPARDPVRDAAPVSGEGSDPARG